MTTTAIQFVSLGPGDPELITLKSLRALQAADCILCPATRKPDGTQLSRSADILRQLPIHPAAIRTFLLPMSKERSAALAAYDAVYADALRLQREGERVCIVAEGDSGLYSSIHYVLERLQQDGIPVAQLAGIPAFVASGARGCLHLASQEERLTLIPGNATLRELEELTARLHTIVVMKLPQCADEVKRFLTAHPDRETHYFENTGTPAECYLTDTDAILARSFPYFSLLIIK